MTASPRQVPSAWVDTTIYTRGDLPDYDPARIWLALPRIASVLPDATRVVSAPLGEDALSLLLDDGLPTLIWQLGAVEIAGPADSAGHRVWSVEILLGEAGSGERHAIVTFDRENGSAYAYRIDRDLVPVVRAAVGLPVASGRP